jgi:hypothetical protein
VVAFDQRFRGNSSVGFINTSVLRSNTEGTARDANVSALTANINFLNNSHYFNASLARSQVFDIDAPYGGTSAGWNLGKQVGSWRWNHRFELVTPEFDPNDLGFQRRGNKLHQRINVSHELLEPQGPHLRRRHRIGVQYNRLYDPSSFERVHVEYSYFGLLKSFLAYGYNAEVRPDEVDFYDARVWGRYRINPASIWHNAWLSTDFRKPIAYELRGGQWAWADYGARGLYGAGELIVRVNDHLNFRSEVNINSNHQVGWAQTLSTDSIGMALRHRREVSQSLRGQYLFGPNSWITLNMRHSWNRIESESTFHLNDDGTMKPSLSYEDPDLRINFFNVDLKYVLWFSPGRELNLLYRASLANSDQDVDLGYIQNMQSLTGLPTDHLLSLRVVYFLDYAQIRNSSTFQPV